MKYKSIIFDLDGTVVPSVMEGMPSEKVVRAVKKIKDKIKLSSASGRAVIYCRNIWNALDIADPCVVNGGSQIVNPKTEEIIWEKCLPEGVIPKIIQTAKDYTDSFAINGVFLNIKKDQNKIPPKANIIVALGVKKNKSDELVKLYNQIPGVVAHTLNSWVDENCWDIHITHKLATKKHGIEKLIEILGLRKEEVIGIGDGNNDIPLFESVGYKVAMGNGVGELKKAADYITDDFKNDGFAKFLEEKL